MSKIRQTLILYEAGNGTKSISDMLDLSRNTVKKYISIFNQSNKTIDEVLAMNDSDFHALFQEKANKDNSPRSERYQATMEVLPEYAKMLKRKGMTLQRVYEKYIQDHPDGFSRSRFCTMMKLHQTQTAPVAHLEHKAGEKMYVDYAGDKLHIIDQETGERLPVEVFVAILPCSQLTYVEAVMSQKKEDFIHACEKAFYFYGGTPKIIVPDNLKAAVTRPSKYESVLNDDFAAFAEHYGCAVLPARVRKPKDKALVEGAVKLIYRSIYPYLEKREFYNLEALNEVIRGALESHNNARLTGRNYSRREQFEEIERECLGPLNPIKFELRSRKRLTVSRQGYVRLENHFYSVPVKYCNKKVIVLYDTRSVDMYFEYECIASHKRSFKQYGYSTKTEHLPQTQQNYQNWDPNDLIKQGASIHPEVQTYLMQVMEKKSLPEQAYKSIAGILNIGKKVGVDRLIKACRLANALGDYSYNAIDRILSNRQENIQFTDDTGIIDGEVPVHGNVRGKEYYK